MRRAAVPLALVLLLSASASAGCDDDPDAGAIERCEELHPECAALCDDLCARLLECTTAGELTCASECERTYLCAGETPDQDGAICRGRADTTEELACAELCAEDAFGQQSALNQARSSRDGFRGSQRRLP